MLREDERDQRRQEATAHALLVEGVALAVRGKPEAIIEHAAAWRKAEWLEPGAQDAPPPGPPPLNLLLTPYVQAAIRAATQEGSPTQASSPASAPEPTKEPAPPEPAPTPAYRLRKAARRGP